LDLLPLWGEKDRPFPLKEGGKSLKSPIGAIYDQIKNICPSVFQYKPLKELLKKVKTLTPPIFIISNLPSFKFEIKSIGLLFVEKYFFLK
jgi:hypothetical protein